MKAHRDYGLLWLAAGALLSIVLLVALDNRERASYRFTADVKYRGRVGTACSAVLLLAPPVCCFAMVWTRPSRRRTVVLFFIIGWFALTAVGSGVASVSNYFGLSSKSSRDPMVTFLYLVLAAENAAAAIYGVRFTLPARLSRTSSRN